MDENIVLEQSQVPQQNIENDNSGVRNSNRVRKPPVWMKDFEDFDDE